MHVKLFFGIFAYQARTKSWPSSLYDSSKLAFSRCTCLNMPCAHAASRRGQAERFVAPNGPNVFLGNTYSLLLSETKSLVFHFGGVWLWSKVSF